MARFNRHYGDFNQSVNQSINQKKQVRTGSKKKRINTWVDTRFGWTDKF